MFRRLPSLTALRAFEAAARLRSLTLAGRELGVTHGAVSRQIGLLEDETGVELLKRRTTGVEPTAAGEDLARAVHDGLAGIRRAVAALPGAAAEVRVLVAPMLATRWLIPRLAGFQKQHPTIRLTLDTLSHPSTGAGGNYDYVIAFVQPGDPALAGEPLLRELATPLASPELIARLEAEGIRHVPEKWPLLLNTDDGWDWKRWAATYSAVPLDFAKALRFDVDNTAVVAGLAGLGVALVELGFARRLLERGLLVPVLDTAPIPMGSYVVSRPSSGAESHAQRAFREWLIAETGPSTCP